VVDPPDTLAHDVILAAGSRLDELLKTGAPLVRCAVNSRHHQSVKVVGRDLVVTAVAPDGVIEALEDPSLTFCIGVQWHPENFRMGEFDALFVGLIEAAHRRHSAP
jgi:putative glutamine amidotransferase